MKVKLLKDKNHHPKKYNAGDIAEIPNNVADRWVRRGIAEYVDDCTDCDNNEISIHDKVSIVILVKDALKYFKICLDSLMRNTYNYELIIIDNSSTADTKKYLVDMQARLGFRLITNSKNKGFAYGCNQGIKESTCDYICFLNSDTVLTKNWLAKLMDGLKQPHAGASGPSSCWVSGKQMLVGYSNNRDSMTEAQMNAVSTPKGYEEAELIGFCLLIKKEVLNLVGGFDHNRFPLAMGEDRDFVRRIKRAGYRTYWVKHCYVHHYGGKTHENIKHDWSAEITKCHKVLKEIAGGDIYVENDVDTDNKKKSKKQVRAGIKIGFYVDKQKDKSPGKRLRVYNIAQHIKDSVVSTDFDELKKCDIVMLQAKYDDINLVKNLKELGIKVVFDTGEPHWDRKNFFDKDNRKEQIDKMLDYVDVVTFPTEVLAESFKKWKKDIRVEVIPDSLDMSKHNKTKKHRQNKQQVICWYGCCSNVCQLNELARADLERLGKEFNLKLIAVYDSGLGFDVKPFDNLELEIIKWTEQATIDAILNSDVVVNPRYLNWKKYKSRNKTMEAYSLGVPCVEYKIYNNVKKYLLSADLREQDGKQFQEIAKEFDSMVIAKKLQELYADIVGRIDVIIPVLDRPEETRQTLEALFKNNDNLNVIIIDNGSDDLGYLKDFDVTVVKNKTNSGVAASFQQGLALSKSNYIVLMHNDIMVNTDNWIKKAIDFMRVNPFVGIVAQAGWKYMGKNLEYKKENLITTIERYNKAPKDFTEVIVIDGCCNVIRNIGLSFDKNLDYFFYDFDLSLKYKSLGYKSYVMSGSSIHFADDRTKATINTEKGKRTKDEINIECSRGVKYIQNKWDGWFPLSV